MHDLIADDDTGLRQKCSIPERQGGASGKGAPRGSWSCMCLQAFKWSLSAHRKANIYGNLSRQCGIDYGPRRRCCEGYEVITTF